MKSVYVVRAIPVRDEHGTIQGWVRADVLADGSKPSDAVFLRDGSICAQVEALDRVARDPGLLYSTEEEAVREGIARLRAADRAGLSQTRV
jgi:hypothetical protein